MPTSGTMRRSSVRDAYLCLSPSLGSLFPTELVIPLFPRSLLSVYPFTLAFAFFPLILSLFCVLFFLLSHHGFAWDSRRPFWEAFSLSSLQPSLG